MIGKTDLVDSFIVSLSASFIRKKFLPDEAHAERNVLKLSTNSVLPIMSLFNQFSAGSALEKESFKQNRVLFSQVFSLKTFQEQNVDVARYPYVFTFMADFQ